MTIFVDQMRTARKSHVCYNCRRAIDAGSPYTYLSGVSDGQGWSGKTHADCREAEIGLNQHYETDSQGEWNDLATFYGDEGRDVLEWLAVNHPTVRERFPRSLYAAPTSEGTEPAQSSQPAALSNPNPQEMGNE